MTDWNRREYMGGHRHCTRLQSGHFMLVSSCRCFGGANFINQVVMQYLSHTWRCKRCVQAASRSYQALCGVSPILVAKVGAILCQSPRLCL
jgi:hypothetical protein